MKNSEFYFLSCKYCTFSLQPLRQKSQIFAASPYTGEAFYRLPLCPVHTGQRGLSPTTLKRMLQSGKEEGRSGYAVSPALTQTGETKCSEFLLTREGAQCAHWADEVEIPPHRRGEHRSSAKCSEFPAPPETVSKPSVAGLRRKGRRKERNAVFPSLTQTGERSCSEFILTPIPLW